MSHTVGEIARLAGVSVRTLHHYDEIGLLSPGGRSPSGYRHYGPEDLERLQRILCYRALGFDLTTTKRLLDDPALDALGHLRRQRQLLSAQIEHLKRMIASVDKLMEARQMGINLTPDEMLEAFGEFDPTEHAAEAEERWGETDAYKESQRRTSRYTKEDWKRLNGESEQITERLAEALRAGEPASGERAMALAEEARLHIDRWFYPCSHEMHRNLGEMYVADPRFAKHYESRRAGLAAYVRDAIVANAERAARQGRSG